MRFFRLIALGAFTFAVAAQTPPGKLWDELKAKRQSLASYHQEFDVSRTYRIASGDTQASKWQITLDGAQDRWRERNVSGSGDRVRIYDGVDLSHMDSGGTEYIRRMQKSDDKPESNPYDLGEVQWSKAVEKERKPCGIPGVDHLCVILEAPVKGAMRVGAGSSITQMEEGIARVFIDIETGLLLTSRMTQITDRQRGSSYQAEVIYVLTHISYGKPADAALFRLPVGLREVKELSAWNAARIKKELVGKPAPELKVLDIKGNPVSLNAMKGKTTLLDFWTTWCPPCRADAPALDKLHQKYGDKDLAIVAISVSEDRPLVEQFLKEHPHAFPTVLTSENEMPRAYQIGVFPTYIIINSDGSVAAAVEGDKGFGELRKHLKKAGLDVD